MTAAEQSGGSTPARRPRPWAWQLVQALCLAGALIALLVAGVSAAAPKGSAVTVTFTSATGTNAAVWQSDGRQHDLPTGGTLHVDEPTRVQAIGWADESGEPAGCVIRIGRKTVAEDWTELPGGPVSCVWERRPA